MLNEKTKIKNYFLSDAERDRLGGPLARVRYDSAGPFDPFVEEAKRVFRANASAEMLAVLNDFKRAAPDSGVCVIHNNPFDESICRGLLVGEDARKIKKNALSEAFLTGLTAQLGEPYSIWYEEKALVNNLCPSVEDREKFTGLGSDVELDLHAENAAARRLPGDRSPEGLVLTGVSKESGEGPPTKVGDARLALSLCSPFVETELRKPNFEISFPDRWYPDGTEHYRVKTSVLEGTLENPTFIAALYSDMMKANTTKAKKALAEFFAALRAVETAVFLKPGMTLLLNNRTVFHGRGKFTATFDNGRPLRWVQRLFYTSSLERMGEWKRKRDRVLLPVVHSNVCYT